MWILRNDMSPAIVLIVMKDLDLGCIMVFFISAGKNILKILVRYDKMNM